MKLACEVQLCCACQTVEGAWVEKVLLIVVHCVLACLTEDVIAYFG